MAKIDRLGWADGICIEAFGVRIGIRVNDASALPAIVSCLPPNWKPLASPIVDALYSVIVGGSGWRPGVRRLNLLYAGALRLARTTELSELLTALETDVKMHVAESARRRVFVHAGVVGWKGRAIVIPGRSYSGKSSLVAALVKAGAVYYSDEYAVLDAQGRVHPYAKPLALRRDTGQASRKITAEELGGVTGSAPLPLGLVIVSQYKPEARWRPRTRSVGQGILDLLAHTVPARRQPKIVLTTLRRAATSALILRGIRGEAEWIVDDVLNRVAEGSRN